MHLAKSCVSVHPFDLRPYHDHYHFFFLSTYIMISIIHSSYPFYVRRVFFFHTFYTRDELRCVYYLENSLLS